MLFLAGQDVFQVTIEWLRITPTTVEGVHRELGRLGRWVKGKVRASL